MTKHNYIITFADPTAAMGYDLDVVEHRNYEEALNRFFCDHGEVEVVSVVVRG